MALPSDRYSLSFTVVHQIMSVNSVGAPDKFLAVHVMFHST